MRRLLDIQMLIGQDRLLIGRLHLNVVFYEVIWYFGRARNKIWLLDPVHKKNTEKWLWPIENYFRLISCS